MNFYYIIYKNLYLVKEIFGIFTLSALIKYLKNDT